MTGSCTAGTGSDSEGSASADRGGRQEAAPHDRLPHFFSAAPCRPGPGPCAVFAAAHSGWRNGGSASQEQAWANSAAFCNGNEASARMLIKAGGKELLFKTDIEGASALHSAARSCHGDFAGFVRELVEEGGKELVLLVMNDGKSALHQAASSGHVEVVRLLIGAGRQRLLFLTSEDGSSPLHMAACNGHVDVSWLLVERGGKRLLAANNIDGETAAVVATREGHGALAGMLRGARPGRTCGGRRGLVSRRRRRRWRLRGRTPPCPNFWRRRRSREVRQARPVAAAVEGRRGAARARRGQARRSEVLCSVHPHDGMGWISAGVADPPQAAAGVSWISGHLPQPLRRSRSAQQ